MRRVTHTRIEVRRRRYADDFGVGGEAVAVGVDVIVTSREQDHTAFKAASLACCIVKRLLHYIGQGRNAPWISPAIVDDIGPTPIRSRREIEGIGDIRI